MVFVVVDARKKSYWLLFSVFFDILECGVYPIRLIYTIGTNLYKAYALVYKILISYATYKVYTAYQIRIIAYVAYKRVWPCVRSV